MLSIAVVVGVAPTSPRIGAVHIVTYCVTLRRVKPPTTSGLPSPSFPSRRRFYPTGIKLFHVGTFSLIFSSIGKTSNRRFEVNICFIRLLNNIFRTVFLNLKQPNLTNWFVGILKSRVIKLRQIVRIVVTCDLWAS